MAYSYTNLCKIIIVGLRFTVYGPFGRPDMSYYSSLITFLIKFINVLEKEDVQRLYICR